MVTNSNLVYKSYVLSFFGCMAVFISTYKKYVSYAYTIHPKIFHYLQSIQYYNNIILVL